MWSAQQGGVLYPTPLLQHKETVTDPSPLIPLPKQTKNVNEASEEARHGGLGTSVPSELVVVADNDLAHGIALFNKLGAVLFKVYLLRKKSHGTIFSEHFQTIHNPPPPMPNR